MVNSRADRPISADDLAAALAVRDDLGPGHDEAVLAEFLDRVGPAIGIAAINIAHGWRRGST